ncbi:MAG: hypothetical protein ACKVOU_15515 [Cytophagales bacterium]
MSTITTVAENTLEQNKPSKKKPIFAVSADLRSYLKKHGREVKLPVSYKDLLRISYSTPVLDQAGKDTFWEQAFYDTKDFDFLREGLVIIYAILKTEGDLRFTNQLDIDRIDYCPFGNSNPFRIRIINKFNKNYDYFYIKKTDATRVYGLELEHTLSPNRIIFYTCFETLVEEHVPGVPGDIFIKKYLNDSETNKVRFAKEFVKFNERCFVRLLGDMRSYNFVVHIIPDIEDYQYRIRAIDFDQQSYEGRKNLYLPQFFKENVPLVSLTMHMLNRESIEQYQSEERNAMALRVVSSRFKLMELFNIMCKEKLSSDEKVKQLTAELASFFGNAQFLKCKSMGDIVKTNLKETLRKNLLLVQTARGNITD